MGAVSNLLFIDYQSLLLWIKYAGALAGQLPCSEQVPAYEADHGGPEGGRDGSWHEFRQEAVSGLSPGLVAIGTVGLEKKIRLIHPKILSEHSTCDKTGMYKISPFD